MTNEVAKCSNDIQAKPWVARNYLKTALIAILTIIAFQNHLLAQQSGTADHLAYVAGPEYKVTNQENGFTVEWNGAPAKPEQIKRVDDREVHILNPAGDVRLVIYLWPSGAYSAVVDLKYTNPTAYFARQARDHEDGAGELRNEEYQKSDEDRRERAESFDWMAYREFVFQNGMQITISAGVAKATLNGETLEVTGSRGRYRVKTATFEAGLAFGPNYPENGYQYLRIY